jgi:hypothetical protein
MISFERCGMASFAVEKRFATRVLFCEIPRFNLSGSDSPPLAASTRFFCRSALGRDASLQGHEKHRAQGALLQKLPYGLPRR